MADQKTSPLDLNALAMEACDLWQEHLAAFAADPKAKAELIKLMEPSRRLFAEWAALMQHGPYGTGSFSATVDAGGTKPAKSGGPASSHTGTAARAAAITPASDDSALKLAQLAHRMAELEKRIIKLESRAEPASKTRRGNRTKP